jgi:hypothetical protein
VEHEALPPQVARMGNLWRVSASIKDSWDFHSTPSVRAPSRSVTTTQENSPIGDEEEDLLDMLDDTRHDDSRLTCQVEWSESLEGSNAPSR